jgi:hypothetical protein
VPGAFCAHENQLSDFEIPGEARPMEDPDFPDIAKPFA